MKENQCESIEKSTKRKGRKPQRLSLCLSICYHFACLHCVWMCAFLTRLPFTSEFWFTFAPTEHKLRSCCVYDMHEMGTGEMSFCFCVRATTNRYCFVKALATSTDLFSTREKQQQQQRLWAAGKWMSGGRRVEMEAKGIHVCVSSKRFNGNNSVVDDNEAATTTSIIKTTTSVSASSPSQSLKCVRSGLTESVREMRCAFVCARKMCVACFTHTIFIMVYRV